MNADHDEPPDIWKRIQAGIWKWIVSRLGLRWAIALFVVGSIAVGAFSYRDYLAVLWNDVSSTVSEHMPLPKADPNVFTVGIVPLDNDEKGQMEHDIAEGLDEVKGIDVREFNRQLISDRDVKAGHELAHKYLKQSGAEVLIWGTVLRNSGKSVPKLYWTVSGAASAAKESGHYPLTEDLSLPPIFVGDLVNVLRLLVATQSTGFSAQEGHFVSNQLAPFIERVRHLLEGAQTQGWSAGDVAHVKVIFADALVTFGEQTGHSEPLQEAVSAYRAALLVLTRERVPLEWAATQNNFGIALRNLGERESGTAHLQEAVAAYRAALLEYTRERDPLEWAATQNDLGAALGDLGERESGTAHLQEAVAAFRAALLEYTRESVPLEWAGTQNNLGAALGVLGEHESGTTHLQEAVAAHRLALLEYTREHDPLDWAMTQNNLGVTQRALGRRQRDPKQLCDALQAHIAAWQVAKVARHHNSSMFVRNAWDDIDAIRKGSSPAYGTCLADHAKSLKQMGIGIGK